MLKPEKKTDGGKKKTVKENILYGSIAALPSLIYVFFLLNQNLELLLYWQAAVVAVVFAAVAAGAFALLARLLRDARAAALIVLFLSVAFFFYTSVYNVLCGVFGGLPMAVYLPAYAVVVALACWLLYRAAKKLTNMAVYRFGAFFLAVLLLINLVPATWQAARRAGTTQAAAFDYKDSFVVEDGLAQPNVYWFHMDGMLSTAAMEEFFGADQEPLLEELASRGFVVNRDAWFEAGYRTSIAVPALMSPDFYDRYQSELNLYTGAPDVEEYIRYSDALRSNPDLVYAPQKAASWNELIRALNAAEYSTTILSHDYFVFPSICNSYYYLFDEETPIRYRVDGQPLDNSKLDAIDKLGTLKELMAQTSALSLLGTPLEAGIRALRGYYMSYKPLGSTVEDPYALLSRDATVRQVALLNCLNDVLATESESPKFVLVHNVDAHAPYLRDADGLEVRQLPATGKDDKSNDIYDYPPVHEYAAKVMLGMVDMVLEADPDAVIVLQSDHGLSQSWQYIREEMEELDTARLLLNSTMSAVRIPEKYGGLDAPLDPLNISRVLVNRYVGQNYELLPPNQPNQRFPNKQ